MRARDFVFVGEAMAPATAVCLDNYLEHRRHPGDFLAAVLSNDLKEAFARADTWNITRMHIIVAFLWSHVPAVAWGSREAFRAWLAAALPTHLNPEDLEGGG